MVRIKICGMTNLEDALAATALGADALGFVFYAKSPRCVSPLRATAIASRLPPFIARVGVFVDEQLERVKEIVKECDLDYAQLHGSESPDFCRQLGNRVIKTLRVKDESVLRQLSMYKAPAFLLDTYKAEMPGGTGQTFNWDIAARAARSATVVLSGGLKPQNVAQAIAAVQPYAVDVSSGVEASPGKKDHEKLRAFIEAARGA
ncbi:MAG: phosphoribosylanthranilate isomerase [Chloroflexi bacterium]|nr:phosphoribosylanthranilate isomerase [Chloroflexota bacterium]